MSGCRGALEDDGVTRGQRVVDLPQGGHERGVPRSDGADDAVRLVADLLLAEVAEDLPWPEVLLPREGRDQVIEEVHPLDHEPDVGEHVGTRDARFGDEEVLELSLSRPQAVLELEHALLRKSRSLPQSEVSANPRAEAMASSRSSTPASAASAITDSSVGLITGQVLPDRARRGTPRRCRADPRAALPP